MILQAWRPPTKASGGGLTNMRLLVVYPYIPFPLDRGTYHRTFHLLKALAARHDVDFFALSENGERLEQRSLFEHFCRRVKLVPFVHPPWPRLFPDRLLHPLPTTVRHWRLPQIAEKIEEFTQYQHYELIHVCDIVMAQYFLGTSTPISVDRSRVDLQFQQAQAARTPRGLVRRMVDRENLVKLRRYERRIAQRAALEVVCGPDDEQFIRRQISRTVQIEVIPNGVDLNYFDPSTTTVPRDSEPTVLFCGAMDYFPNVDALRWYFKEIHELLCRQVPGYKVLLVGNSPVAEVQAYARRPGVTVTGGVPDVRPYYRRAWLQIVPLRIGGGTRLKIPESLAIGTPVVSTTIGAQGLDLRHGQEILLGDTAEQFVEFTACTLKNAALRKSLEVAGRETVRARLSWPALGKRLNEVYKRFEKVVA